MRVLLRKASLVFVFCCLAAVIALAQANRSPDVNQIIDRMLAAHQDNKQHLRPFSVKRNYQLLDKKSEPKAEVVANITYRPPDQKQYSIESASGGLGEKVLRDIVARETETAKDPGRREISRENYDFKFLREDTVDGRRCYVLGMNPRREDKDLLRGEVWIDAESYKVHRLQGKPMKSPSWWIRDLTILMTFTDVSGMWLHTATQAVANVRFKGKYMMVSHDVEYHAAGYGLEAPRNSAIFAGAAVRR